MVPRAALLVAVAAACAPRSVPVALPAAGTDGDDGTGVLSRASVRFETGAGEPEGFADDTRTTTGYGDGYGGYLYGGGLYGGGAYGGVSYAGWQVGGTTSPANRTTTYMIHSLADAGGVGGTVTWKKPPAVRRLRSPCGEIDNPSLRVGPRGEAGGAIVYLEKIVAGRPLATMGSSRPLAVGGTVERAGCAVHPTTQVVSPVPTTITIYDSRGGAAVVRGAGVDPIEVQLAAGGFRTVAIGPGVTQVTADDGRAAPAWIVAPGHPYFALTDDRGRFRIDDVVPGTYELVVWHPPVVTGWAQGKAQFGAPVVVTRTIKVGANTTSNHDIALP